LSLGEDIDFDRITEWHHPVTIKELRRIRHFVDQHRGELEYDFLRVCFSDILSSCTARRGKEHGYFADNTPLGKSIGKAPYQPAIDLFLERIERNVGSIERLYVSLERLGLPPVEACARATVLNSDARSLDRSMLPAGVDAVDAIICSPPYLGMADYSLGLRLSYYWLFPEKLAIDFGKEVGARRRRSEKDKALVDYNESMRRFIEGASKLVRKNGYLAMVIGAPVSTAFKDKEVLCGVDEIFREAGFDRMWDVLRPINWHRNHGYARLNNERVSVHVFNGGKHIEG